MEVRQIRDNSKMKNILFFLLVISASFGCTGDAEIVVPENVLSEEKMAAVLLDVHLAEASMNLNVNPQSIQKTSTDLKVDILKKHNIDKKMFDESFQFYTENPALLNEVYQAVLNELSKMQAQVMNEK